MQMEQRAQKLALIRSERTLVVSVDIANHKHWAAMVDGQTDVPLGSPFAFHNSRHGFSRLLGQIAKAQAKIGATRVVVGMEPTGHYWRPLASFLQEAGLTVVLVNPYHVRTSKEHDDRLVPVLVVGWFLWLVNRAVKALESIAESLRQTEQ